MSKSFIKKVEDFICEHCGNAVSGNGFTNHCPKCLWSKHVDVSPGDRAEDCAGLMEPIKVLQEGDKISLVHKCISCEHQKKNKISKEDDFDEVVKISKKMQRIS